MDQEMYIIIYRNKYIVYRSMRRLLYCQFASIMVVVRVDVIPKKSHSFMSNFMSIHISIVCTLILHTRDHVYCETEKQNSILTKNIICQESIESCHLSHSFKTEKKENNKNQTKQSMSAKIKRETHIKVQ